MRFCCGCGCSCLDWLALGIRPYRLSLTHNLQKVRHFSLSPIYRISCELCLICRCYKYLANGKVQYHLPPQRHKKGLDYSVFRIQVTSHSDSPVICLMTHYKKVSECSVWLLSNKMSRKGHKGGWDVLTSPTNEIHTLDWLSVQTDNRKDWQSVYLEIPLCLSHCCSNHPLPILRLRLPCQPVSNMCWIRGPPALLYPSDTR